MAKNDKKERKMLVEKVYKLVEERGENDFLRDSLIALAKQKETPSDIFESEFGDVVKTENEYIGIVADVNIDYTCSVGYDRQEEYYDKVKKYDSTIKDYRYEYVKKTRTVTDWSPFSGSNSTRETTMVANKGDGYSTEKETLALESVRTTKADNIVAVEEEFIGNEDAIRRAKNYCLGACYVHAIKPGDHQKDGHYSGHANIADIGGYNISEYSMNYKYNGETYRTDAFASGSSKLRKTFPNIAKDVKAEASAKLKPFLYAGIGCFVAALILSILFTALGFLAFAAGVACIVLYFVKRSKAMNEAFAVGKEKKKEQLQQMLKAKGLAPLSPDELNNI